MAQSSGNASDNTGFLKLLVLSQLSTALVLVGTFFSQRSLKKENEQLKQQLKALGPAPGSQRVNTRGSYG